MPDPTIHILSTRPLAKKLLDQGLARGIAIEAFSFIETTPVTDSALAHRILDLATTPITAVFTSMNAVEAVVQHLQPSFGSSSSPGPSPSFGSSLPSGPSPSSGSSSPPGPSSPFRSPWQIFCIGSATRELIQKYFGDEKIRGAAPSANALAATIIDCHPPDIFFFCGDQRRDDLPDQLTKASIKVNEIIVYHTRLTPHKLASAYDGIAFFSPSAVHSFFSVNSIPGATILFAIGATTAAAIHTHVSNTTIVSASPEKETLICQMMDYLQNE